MRIVLLVAHTNAIWDTKQLERLFESMGSQFHGDIVFQLTAEEWEIINQSIY